MLIGPVLASVLHQSRKPNPSEMKSYVSIVPVLSARGEAG